ncbi:MAG TPA: thiaminase II [Lichenihabitans sp.]|nr:thiaminase II [Lichenihabitans sp.]
MSEPNRFSAAAWHRNAALYAAIRDMPFNAELMRGTLRIDRFRHYVVQDAKYLIGFGQALALAAAKADDPAGIEQFSRAASEAIVVERALHADYFRRFGIAPETVAATPQTPVCHHYLSFLVASGYREPLPIHAAALLPCFWVYREVGRHIFAAAAPQNPYRAWIDTYAGQDFSEAVDAMIATTDGLARNASPAVVEAMHGAFALAMRLEWMFWDSAYRLADWPC